MLSGAVVARHCSQFGHEGFVVRISDRSQEELGNIFSVPSEFRVAPAGHFLELAEGFPMIYGADGPQREYLNILLDWLDNTADRDVARFPKADHYHVSNYFIDWSSQGWVDASGLRRGDIHEPFRPEQERDRQSFFNRFSASRSRLGDISTAALAHDQPRAGKLAAGVRKDDARKRLSPDNLTSGPMLGALRQFAVRRACKFLIYDTIRQGYRIAYALDDLDLGAVVARTAFPLETDPERGKVPVCTSELREVFRRWDVCQHWVFFYEDLHGVPPPWDQSRGEQAVQSWAAYAAARATKLALRLPQGHGLSGMLNQVSTLHQNGQHVQAISTYHAAQPSSLGPLPNAVW
jgi:hypothetical protein